MFELVALHSTYLNKLSSPHRTVSICSTKVDDCYLKRTIKAPPTQPYHHSSSPYKWWKGEECEWDLIVICFILHWLHWGPPAVTGFVWLSLLRWTVAESIICIYTMRLLTSNAVNNMCICVFMIFPSVILKE